MKTGDSLEDFGLSECREEELAALAQTAQVVAVEGGPSQAKTAVHAIVSITNLSLGGVEGGILASCTFGDKIGFKKISRNCGWSGWRNII